jgi:hypothetical protein
MFIRWIRGNVIRFATGGDRSPIAIPLLLFRLRTD